MMVARPDAVATSARPASAWSSIPAPASVTAASDAFSAGSPTAGGSIRQTCSSAVSRSRRPSMTCA